MIIRPFSTSLRFITSGILVLGAVAVVGQEVPPPTQEVTLVYKYKTGNLQKFRMEAKGDMTVTPEGGGIGPIPVSSKVATIYSEKVTGTREGTGTLAAKFETFQVDADLLGNALAGRMVNGKLKYTINGQPAPEGGVGAALAAGADVTRVLTLKRSALGAITEGAGPNAGGTGPGNTLVQFPEHPVKVGDSWETTQPVGSGIASGPVGAAVQQAKFTHTLKSLVTKDKRLFALVESLGASISPEDPTAPVIKVNISGTTRIDVERGVLVGGQYSIDTSGKIGTAGFPGAGGGAPADGAAAPSMKLDGITTLTVQEVPATAAPAAKKPAAKKPVRKRK